MRTRAGILLAVTSLCIAGIGIAAGQDGAKRSRPGFLGDPESASYRALVEEIYVTSGEAEKMQKALRFLDDSLMVAYRDFYQQAAEERIAFADEQARARYLDRMESNAQQFNERFLASMPLDTIALDAVVGIYAEIFTEKDLRQIVEFMRSPVGAKFLGQHAFMFQYTLQYVQGRMYQLVQRDIAAAQIAELERLVEQWGAAADPG